MIGGPGLRRELTDDLNIEWPLPRHATLARHVNSLVRAQGWAWQEGATSMACHTLSRAGRCTPSGQLGV